MKDLVKTSLKKIQVHIYIYAYLEKHVQKI